MNYPRSPMNMKAHARRSWTGDNTGFAGPSYATGTPQPVLGTPRMPVHGTPRTPHLPVHGTPHMPVHGTPRHHVGTPYYPDHRQLDSFQLGHPRASPGMMSNKSFDYSPYSQASDLAPGRGGFSSAYSEPPVIPAGTARRRSHSFTTPAGGGFSPAVGGFAPAPPVVPMGPVFSPFDGAYPPTPFPPTPSAYPTTPVGAYPSTPGVYPATPSGYPTTPGVYPATPRHSRGMSLDDFAIARDSGYEGADYRRGRRSSSVFQGPPPAFQGSPTYHRGRRSSSAHQGRPSSTHRGRSSSAHRGRSSSAHRGRSSSAHPHRSSSALRGRSSSAHPTARGHRRSASAVTFAYPEATYIAPGMFSNTIKFRVKHAEESGICLRDIIRDDFRVSGKYTYRVYSNTLRDIQIEWPGYPSEKYRVEFRVNSEGNLNLRKLARSLGESCKLYFQKHPVPFDWTEARLYCIRDTGGLWKMSLH